MITEAARRTGARWWASSSEILRRNDAPPRPLASERAMNLRDSQPIAEAPLQNQGRPTRGPASCSRHESAEGHVTGRAQYVDDMAANVAHLAHAWPVMSPHARARVLDIDLREARALPGVLDVLTAADVPGENDVGPARRDEPLFPSEVSFHGQAVAWVIGETEEQARLGAKLVRVTYEPLAPILSIAEAIAAQSFLTEPEWMRRGDAEGALSQAAHRLEGELFIGGQEHFYLETQAALALIDESGAVLVHSSTQHPAETQEIVARVLGSCAARGGRAVPAHGRGVRRQRGAGQRVGRRRRDRRPKAAAAPSTYG